jgi:hypothetical protein
MRRASVVIVAMWLALGAAGAGAQQQGTHSTWNGPGMMGMDPDDVGMMSMMMQMRGMAIGPGAMPMMGMGEHIEGSLAFLKAELKITPAQESLWNAFAETMRANAETMAAMTLCCGGAQGGGTMHQGMMSGQGAMPSLPDRLDWQEMTLALRLDGLRATKVVLVPLYAAFSDEQKQTADQLVHWPMRLGMMM